MNIKIIFSGNVPKKTPGFTLLEVMVAVSIFVVIILIWNKFIIQSWRSISFGQEQLESIHQAQKGLEIMTQELREAITAENGAYALEKASDQEVIFYSDIDQDASTERVRYFLNGTSLIKGVIEPSGDPLEYLPENEIETIAAQFINNGTIPIFTYFNENYPSDTENNPLPSPTRLIETKLMHILLLVNVNPQKAPQNFAVESDVQLRNLKTNL